ncbi:MAG TPA: cytochrome c [Steroidobacteraceae bacterium]|nr:cytochrome c [Steroidobacteraceae bacterium]
MRLIRLLPLALLIVSSVAPAALDLSDFDEDAMRAVEDAQKELESGIPSRDTQIVVANAEFIRDSLQWAQGYFDKRNIADAVKLAHDGSEYAQQIATHASANDFDAANEAFGQLKRTCKSCHDAYKPPDI